MNKDKTILIIDDEHGARIALEQCLSNEGYDVIVAGSVSTALELLNEIYIDLIVSDWHLGDVNGTELLQKLRGGNTGSTNCLTTPFLIITGVYTQPEDLEYAFHLGATDYIQKPVATHKIELVNRVQKAFIEHEKIKNAEQQKLNEENHRISKMMAYEEMMHSFKRNIEKMIADTPTHKNKLYDLLYDYERAMDKIKEDINNLFPEFLHLLGICHPSLPKDDALICACILLKEGNPTIAHQFGMSDESFRKRKMRLKDKLNISKGVGFYVYLRSFYNTQYIKKPQLRGDDALIPIATGR